MRETVALKDAQNNNQENSSDVMSHLEIYIKRQIVELFEAYQKANQDIQDLQKMRDGTNSKYYYQLPHLMDTSLLLFN